MKKFLSIFAILLFGLVAFFQFGDTAQARSNIWRCANCNGQASSYEKPYPGSCPRGSNGHAWYLVND